MPPTEWPDSDTQWLIGETAASFYTSELHCFQLTPDFHELLNCLQQDELLMCVINVVYFSLMTVF